MEPTRAPEVLPVPKGLRNLLPTWEDIRRCRFAFVNGSIVGFIIGVLPGAGATIASFVSYGIEKAVSKRPEQFGTGVIEGVAAPEGANNADTGGRARAAADARHPRTAARRRSCSPRWCCGASSPGRCSSRTARRCSGAWSPACTSATSCCC